MALSIKVGISPMPTQHSTAMGRNWHGCLQVPGTLADLPVKGLLSFDDVEHDCLHAPAHCVCLVAGPQAQGLLYL